MPNVESNLNPFSAGSQKVLLFQKELRSWMDSKPFPPITIDFQISSACNDFCPSCKGRINKSATEYFKERTRRQFFPLNLLSDITSSKNSPQGFIISGDTGEPLLHPEISEIIDMVTAKSAAVVVTNGLALNEPLSQKIVSSCRGIRVSLDAYDAESRQKIHGTPPVLWPKLIDNISTLVAAKKASPESRCAIGVAYLTGENTIAGIEPAIELASQLGVDYIQFRPFHFSQTRIDFAPLIAKYRTPQFNVLASDQKYDNFGSPRSYSTCQAAYFCTSINPWGELDICCDHVAEPRASFGTLGVDFPTWDDFIDSPRRHQLIENFSLSECIPRCSLDRQNCLLQTIKENGTIPPAPDNLSPSVLNHSVFI